MDVNTHLEIEKVIDKLTTDGTKVLNKSYVKQLKNHCKSIGTDNEEAFKYLGSLILRQLEKDHAQIRYGCLLVIEYLFERSHLFRKFMCNNFGPFFQLCLGVRGFVIEENDSILNDCNRNERYRPKNVDNKKPLKPALWAQKLRTKTIDCFQYWHKEFGPGYKILKIGYSFLISRNIIEDESTNNASSSTSTSNWNNDFHSRQQSLQQTQIERIAENFNDIENDTKVIITQIDGCFELLIPKFKIIDEIPVSNDVKFRPMKGLSFNIILNSNVEIIYDSSNSIIIDSLREFCKELDTTYKERLCRVSETLTNLKLSSFNKEIEDLLNKIQNLKLNIGTIVWKFNEIKIIQSAESTSANCQLNNNKSKIPEYNDDYESDDDDEFEEVVEREDTILIHKIENELNNKHNANNPEIDITAGPSQQPESSVPQCNAPLPSGKLCPRKDLVRCPFHGAIIQRDSDGLPLDKELKEIELEAKFQREANEWRDPKYLREVSKQTGHDLEGKSLKNKRRKYPNLIDIKKVENTPRKRLMRKVSSKKVRDKVNNDLSALDRQTHQQFSQQWAYAFSDD